MKTLVQPFDPHLAINDHKDIVFYPDYTDIHYENHIIAEYEVSFYLGPAIRITSRVDREMMEQWKELLQRKNVSYEELSFGSICFVLRGRISDLLLKMVRSMYLEIMFELESM